MARGKKPTLLIDGDLLMFRAATLSEFEECWDEEEDKWTLSCDHKLAKEKFRAYVASIRKKLKGGKLVIAVSDKQNFRLEINESYKGNRKKVRKPVGFRRLLQWIFDHAEEEGWQAISKPKLEADDVIGILLTKPRKPSQAPVIAVTDDKDFLQLPGTVARIGIGDRQLEVFEISPDEADRFFYAQCIAGDAVDGFPGAPGFGIETAFKLLDKGEAVELYDHTLQSGPREGQVVQRKRERPARDPWDTVVSCYEVSGLTEEDALLNARMARILRYSDYDTDKGEPILWQPSQENTA
ncbi:MAG: hypothetical protein AAF608_05175 [Pseudomonadota bacterium]